MTEVGEALHVFVTRSYILFHMIISKIVSKVGLILLLILCFVSIAVAQDLLKGKDLSQVKVSQLSDADIAKLKAQLSSSGMSIDQAEQMAIAKGMPASEFAKLKERLMSASSSSYYRYFKK